MAKIVPAKQYYGNMISPKRLDSFLNYIKNNQQERLKEKINIALTGILALIELDYETDINNVKLNKEKTKEHYLKYAIVAKRYQDLNNDCVNNFISFIENKY